MTTQVQVRLTDDELRQLDELGAGTFTRSDVLRQSIAALVRERRRDVIDQAYADEYRLLPDTDDELRIAEANLRGLLAEDGR